MQSDMSGAVELGDDTRSSPCICGVLVHALTPEAGGFESRPRLAARSGVALGVLHGPSLQRCIENAPHCPEWQKPRSRAPSLQRLLNRGRFLEKLLDFAEASHIRNCLDTLCRVIA